MITFSKILGIFVEKRYFLSDTSYNFYGKTITFNETHHSTQKMSKMCFSEVKGPCFKIFLKKTQV